MATRTNELAGQHERRELEFSTVRCQKGTEEGITLCRLKYCLGTRDVPENVGSEYTMECDCSIG